MKTYLLLIDKDNKLSICGNEKPALEWEVSKGKMLIGKIETELNFLEFQEILNKGIKQ